MLHLRPALLDLQLSPRKEIQSPITDLTDIQTSLDNGSAREPQT